MVNYEQMRKTLTYLMIKNLNKRLHVVTKSNLTDDGILIHINYLKEIKKRNMKLVMTLNQSHTLKKYRKLFVHDKKVCELMRNIFELEVEII